MDTIAAAARGKRPALVFGVQADDTEGMLEYARHAEALEPDGMIAIPPTSAHSLDDFRAYYQSREPGHITTGIYSNERRSSRHRTDRRLHCEAGR